jgi:hypothetical protein
VAGATVSSGEDITASESLGSDNTGSYDSQMVCQSTTEGVLATGTTSASFTVPANPGAITNTRKLAPSISIVKSASRPSFTAAGQRITHTYKVTTTGNVTLTDVTVTDNRLGAVSFPKTTLAPGESMTCHATHTTTAADVAAGTIRNTATATGRPPTGPEVKAESTVMLPFTGAPPPPVSPPPPAPLVPRCR